MGHEAADRAAGWQGSHTPLLVLGFLVLGLGLPLDPISTGSSWQPSPHSPDLTRSLCLQARQCGRSLSYKGCLPKSTTTVGTVRSKRTREATIDFNRP